MKVIMTVVMMIVIVTFDNDMKSKINPKTDHTFLKIKTMFTVLVLCWSMFEFEIMIGNVDLVENKEQILREISAHSSHRHH